MYITNNNTDKCGHMHTYNSQDVPRLHTKQSPVQYIYNENVSSLVAKQNP